MQTLLCASCAVSLKQTLSQNDTCLLKPNSMKKNLFSESDIYIFNSGKMKKGNVMLFLETATFNVSAM